MTPEQLRTLATEYQAACAAIVGIGCGTYSKGSPEYDALGRQGDASRAWHDATSPEAILALLDRIEALEAEGTMKLWYYWSFTDWGEWRPNVYHSRDEADFDYECDKELPDVGPLRSVEIVRDKPTRTKRKGKR